ncbi:DUF4240 domain-containing protein [Hymenobacter aquaticus]|uniref:DUF4240 domain-containing protein n=1 Tax=Hymenobacter aquaticus TaxID=1867101 RepID=A0A4Z0Q8V5_9BACT|nr:DUF4240 domain-containing protein [Hymenobacter aquaticus]TGE25142.1 DUF4240 domain-containing protein [Hymenobacter aquaticus]
MKVLIDWEVTADVYRMAKYFSPTIKKIEAYFADKDYGQSLQEVFIGLSCMGIIEGLPYEKDIFQTGQVIRKKYTKSANRIELKIKINFDDIINCTGDTSPSILSKVFKAACDVILNYKLVNFDATSFCSDIIAQLNKSMITSGKISPEQDSLTKRIEQSFVNTALSNVNSLDETFFWKLISESRNEAGRNLTKQCDLIVSNLISQQEDVILGFEICMRDLLKRLNCHDVLTALKIIHGQISDDSFLYLRCNIILSGKTNFYQFIDNADNINIDVMQMQSGEELLFVADNAFLLKYGDDSDKTLPSDYGMASYDYNMEDGPSGVPVPQEGLKNKFPKLSYQFMR